MPALAQHLQARIAAARSRREMTKAILSSPSETVRVELLAIASRTHNPLV